MRPTETLRRTQQRPRNVAFGRRWQLLIGGIEAPSPSPHKPRKAFVPSKKRPGERKKCPIILALQKFCLPSPNKLLKTFAPSKKRPDAGKKCAVMFRFDGHDNNSTRGLFLLSPGTPWHAFAPGKKPLEAFAPSKKHPDGRKKFSVVIWLDDLETIFYRRKKNRPTMVLPLLNF